MIKAKKKSPDSNLLIKSANKPHYKSEEIMAYFSVITIARGENDPPLSPYVRVCLAHSTDYYEIVQGKIVLSHKLMGDVEIEEAIKWLIEDLKKVQKKAKRDLQKAQENKFKP
ncbi:MAG: hypothetical protein WCD80_09805 [Desulfobaccales bacterium]